MKSRHPFLIVTLAALLVIIAGVAILAPRDPSQALPKQNTNELPAITDIQSRWLEVVIILAVIVVILGITLIRGYRDKPIRNRKQRSNDIKEDTMPVVIAEVISQKGICEAGHKVGDKFIIGQKTPPNLCSWAFYALFPFAEVLEFGGSFPWEKDRSEATVACPDPENPVVFKLRRVE